MNNLEYQRFLNFIVVIKTTDDGKKYRGIGRDKKTALTYLNLAEQGKPIITRDYYQSLKQYFYSCGIKHNQIDKDFGYGKTAEEAYNNWKLKLEKKNEI